MLPATKQPTVLAIGGFQLQPVLQQAPTPTVDSDKVISVFSDAYTNITGVNFNPG